MSEITSPGQVHSLYEERKQDQFERHASYQLIDDAIRGRLPRQYEELFAKGEVRLEVRTIQNAELNLTRLANKVFPIAADQLGGRDSERAKDAAERVEKIAYGWYNGSALRGGTEMDGLAYQLANDQVRYFDGCMLVLPDYYRKLVFFDRVPPTQHFPPVGWTPWSQTRLDNTLIVTEMTLGEVKARYASNDDTIRMRLDKEFSRMISTPKGDYVNDDRQKIKVGQYYSRRCWYVCALGNNHSITLLEMDEDYYRKIAGVEFRFPGVCPVVSFQNIIAEPLFTGQVGIEAALQKVLNQEIQGTQQMLTGPIFGPDIVGEMNWTGYNVVRPDAVTGRTTQPYRMAPNSPLGLERAFGSLMGLSQLHNFNPPSLAGAGEANSGKALQALHAGPSSIVQDILWKPFKNAYPRAFDAALEMEVNLWPNERKKAVGTKGKASFEVDYVPINHLKGYEGHIKIEEGFGLGGYQQVLEGMQLVQAGLMPEEQFFEMHPGIRDVGNWKRQLESSQLSKFADAAFEAASGQDPKMALRAIAEIKKRVDKGMSKFDAIQQVIDEGLMDPPAPEAPPGGGGLPPELAAMMGGGGMEAPPPSLAGARGF